MCLGPLQSLAIVLGIVVIDTKAFQTVVTTPKFLCAAAVASAEVFEVRCGFLQLSACLR